MAGIELFVWHEAAFQYVFKSWPGPVGRHIDGIAEDTIRFARPLIGREYAGESTRSGSGRLAASMRVVHRFARNRDVEAHAGANPTGRVTGYAIYHHEPTGIHGGRGAYPITARNSPNLKFYWRRAGRVVVVRQVRHPGSAGNPYLTDALKIAMRA